jgi:ATP-dependent Clp protease protease subunit
MKEMPILQVSLPEANMQLPSPELVTFYKNLQNRVLWLDTDCDESWLEFIRHIFHWNEEDLGTPVEERRPIKMLLYSFGGDLDVNNAFIDVIRASNTPIWGVNIGQSCSAACFISIACHKRFAMPNATYLIHQGSGQFQGEYLQIVAAVNEYQKKIERLEKYLLETTKIPKDLLEERILTEWYIDAKEAVEYGICDKIITSLDEIL